MTTVAIGGGFDPLHIGHLRLMEEASQFGDKLTVILFRDDQLIKKKGYYFSPFNERKELLESIKYINEVVPNIDADLTSNKSLEFYRPDIWAKSGDRQGRSEAPTCEKIGCGQIWGLAKGIEQSSSRLIRRAIYNNLSLVYGGLTPMKVWGKETWIVNNSQYCGKLLLLRAGAESSYHYHQQKKETFSVLAGEISLLIEDKEYTLNHATEAKTVLPNEKHKFRGITEAVILEVSTTHDEDDVVRLSESIAGRSDAELP